MRSIRQKFLAGAVCVVLGAGALVVSSAPSAEANPNSFTFTGRGHGHGRGMGQWGALGYAVNHGWGWQQILRHYYGGTTLVQNGGNPNATVELQAHNGRVVRVCAPGLRLNGNPLPGNAPCVRLARSGNNIQVQAGQSCNGAWGAQLHSLSQDVRLAPDPGRPVNVANMLHVCTPTSTAASDQSGVRYRGTMIARVRSNTQFLINEVNIQDRVRGVVPREMPAAWGDHGGGAGMNALRAQAVAARSFSLSIPGTARTSGANSCDTIDCQVYGGAARIAANGGVTNLEDARTNRAVDETNGWVVRRANGTIARTEYSASTGGWTAGGEFPAVVDAGDAHRDNPWQNWSVTLTADQLGASLGTGRVRSVEVQTRNGLGGHMGGRAGNVRVVGANSTRTLTGQQLRMAVGSTVIRSDWFTVSGGGATTPPAQGMPRPQAEAVVRALYQDLLGRSVDPAGFNYWTTFLVNGRSQADLVNSLTSSREFVSRRVTAAYRDILGRAPDAHGYAHWMNRIMARQVTVDDVALHFYLSHEFFNQGGGTNEGFVAHMYRVMLGRDGSASEIAHWIGVINRSGRDAAVRGIWFSNEAARMRVSGYFQTFLGRTPDVAGHTHWATVMLRPGAGAVRAGIAGSVEYRNRAMVRFPG